MTTQKTHIQAAQPNVWKSLIFLIIGIIIGNYMDLHLTVDSITGTIKEILAAFGGPVAFIAIISGIFEILRQRRKKQEN